MAYNLKYVAYGSGLGSIPWRVELHEKDFTPAVGFTAIPLRLVGDGITIGYDREEDRFNAIYSRISTIYLKVTNTFNIDTLQFDDERKFQVKIYKNDVLEFIGWLVPFFSSQEYEDDVISTIAIQAKDGINRLKDIRFVDENPFLFSHKLSVKDIICQCLRSIGYNLDVEIYYNKYEHNMLKTSADCPLSQLYVNVKSFYKKSEWINHYDILYKQLNEHDLRIFQRLGKWYIVSPIELVDGSCTGRKFNYLGEYQSTVTLNSDILLGEENYKIRSNSFIRKGIPVQEYTANFEFGEERNLVLNGDLVDFSDFQPANWTLSTGWINGEIQENVGGGIIFQDTYASRPSTIAQDVPISDGSLNKDKYLISNEINVETLGYFSLRSETFCDAELDAVRIRVEFYDDGGTNKRYITNEGKLTYVPSSIYAYNNQTDAYRLVELSWKNVNEFDVPISYKYMKVSVFEGVRTRIGTPLSSTVKFKNIEITGRPYEVSETFKGKRFVITNTDLPNSKKYDDLVFEYKDVDLYKEPEHKNKFYLSNAVGETDASIGKWKRTAETTERTLIESKIIDRLSMTSRFGDIFEGSVYGYIDFGVTPYLSSESKRFLVTHAEYSLQQHTTEVVLVELLALSVNVNIKNYNIFDNDLIVEVSDNNFTTSVNLSENFSTPITSSGGTMYGGVFLDWGIDAIPATSTDPRATNKGVLKVGPEYAQTLELGNRANDTLVDVLGRLSLANNVFYGNGFPLDDGTVLPRLGLNSSELFVEGDFHTYGKYLVNNGLLTLTTETYSVEDNISAGVVSAENERLLLRGAKGIEAQNDFYVGKSYLSNEDIYSGGVFTSSRLRANTDEFQIPGNLNFDTNSKLKINGSFGGDHTFLKSVGDRMEWKDMTVGEITDINDNYVDRLTAQGIDGVKTFNDDVILGGRLKVAGSFGADHYFLKSNGTTQEWAIMNVGEISDIDQNFVRIIVDEGERGFSLYSDYDKNIREAFFFTNPDTGIVGMHGFRLNGSTVEQYGFQMLKDGKPYWLYADGTRKRLLTELDLTGIGGGGTGVTYTLAEPLYFINNQINIRQASSSQTGVLTAANWNTFNSKLADGDTINDKLNFANLKHLYFGYDGTTYDTRIYQNHSALAWYIQSENSDIIIGTYGTSKGIYLMAGNGDISFAGKKYYFTKDYLTSAIDIEIDFSGFATGKVLKATSSTKAEWVTP